MVWPFSRRGSTATLEEKPAAESYDNFEQWYEAYDKIKTNPTRARRMIWLLAAQHFDWLPNYLSDIHIDKKKRITSINNIMLESEAFTRNLPSDAGAEKFAELIGPNANLLGEALSKGAIAKGFTHGLGEKVKAFGKGLDGYAHTFAAALTKDGTYGFAGGLGKNARALAEGLGVNASLFFANLKYKAEMYNGLDNNMAGFFAGFGKNAGLLASSLNQGSNAYNFAEALGKHAKEFAEGLGKNVKVFASGLSADGTNQFALGLGKHAQHFAYGLNGNALDFFMNLRSNASVFIKALDKNGYWVEFKSGMNQDDIKHLREIIPKDVREML